MRLGAREQGRGGGRGVSGIRRELDVSRRDPGHAEEELWAGGGVAALGEGT